MNNNVSKVRAAFLLLCAEVLLSTSTARAADNTNNPAISVIFDGTYSYYSEGAVEEIPGFVLGPHSEQSPEGFSIGHTELDFSGNIDSNFYGSLTAAIHQDAGGFELELEEAYVSTLGLPYGAKVKMGRFFSTIGYLNTIHAHAWDFTDEPLAYRLILGHEYADDGLQLSIVLPTDLYTEFGVEFLQGLPYPGGTTTNNIGAYEGYARVGGDIGHSNSWLAGVSYWQANNITREPVAHAHGGHEEEAEPGVEFTGDSQISGLMGVYQWAPHGNRSARSLRLQAEYFYREDNGNGEIEEADPSVEGTLLGKYKAWYAQAVYQFMPRWRAGLRYSTADSNNQSDNPAFLVDAELDANNFSPSVATSMIDWSPSEFSRIRLQYQHYDYSPGADPDKQLFLQYIYSLGAHKAHSF